MLGLRDQVDLHQLSKSGWQIGLPYFYFNLGCQGYWSQVGSEGAMYA